MTKHGLLSVPLFLGLALVGPGCGSTEEPTAKPDPDLVASNSFEVKLRDNTTAEAVIPAIIEAGHDQLATACAEDPGASVRIFNPLASASYDDIACSTILDGGESVGQTSSAWMSGGEHVGQVQQRWSPFGLACSALMLGATLAWNWPWGQEGCNNPNAENPTACRAVTSLGGGGLGLLCAFI